MSHEQMKRWTSEWSRDDGGLLCWLPFDARASFASSYAGEMGEDLMKSACAAMIAVRASLGLGRADVWRMRLRVRVVVVVLVEEEGCESVWMAAGKVTSSPGSVHLIVVAMVPRWAGAASTLAAVVVPGSPCCVSWEKEGRGVWEGCALHGFSLQLARARMTRGRFCFHGRKGTRGAAQR
jgi:hypothetical protein